MNLLTVLDLFGRHQSASHLHCFLKFYNFLINIFQELVLQTIFYVKYFFYREILSSTITFQKIFFSVTKVLYAWLRELEDNARLKLEKNLFFLLLHKKNRNRDAFTRISYYYYEEFILFFNRLDLFSKKNIYQFTTITRENCYYWYKTINNIKSVVFYRYYYFST